MKAIWNLENKFQKWLDVEIAVLEAEFELDKIDKSVAELTKQNAAFSVERIKEIDKMIEHDVMAFIRNVVENLPDVVKQYFHAGLTSYDIVDTALSLMMQCSVKLIRTKLVEILDDIDKLAKDNKDKPQIGRTHGVHAEPTSCGLKFLNWYDEMERNKGRLDRIETLLAGKISGAVGNYANIDPRIEPIACKKLGIKPARISTQIISRDIHAEYISQLAIIAGSLAKFTTEIRNLQRTEIREMQEPFKKKQKGSSAMPHKKNPVICERITGIARMIRGMVVPALENQDTWHERDLANSAPERGILAEAPTYLYYILDRFQYVLRGLKIYPERMMENIWQTKGVIFSQKVMLALADKGMAREQAHNLVQELALRSWGEDLDFKELLLEDERITNLLNKKEIEACFDLKPYLKNVDLIFKRFGM